MWNYYNRLFKKSLWVVLLKIVEKFFVVFIKGFVWYFEGVWKVVEEELIKIEERFIFMIRDGVVLINRYLVVEICLR